MSEDTKKVVESFAKELSNGSQEVYDLILTCLPDDIYNASKEEIDNVFKEIDIEAIKKLASIANKQGVSFQQEQGQNDSGNDSLYDDNDILSNEDNNSPDDSNIVSDNGNNMSEVDNIDENSQVKDNKFVAENSSEINNKQETHVITTNNIDTNKDNKNSNLNIANNTRDDDISDLISQKSFGYNGICRIIPQRPPFLMIDKVLNLDIKNKTAICQKCVSANEGFFAGHFPGNPVMPGVLMIEAMAQAASIIGKALMNGKKGTLLFASADNVKFNGIATAGDVLTIEAQVTKLRDPLVIGECKVKKQDEIICSCSLKAFRKDI